MTEVKTSSDGLKWVYGGPDTDDHLALGGHEAALGPILKAHCPPYKAYVNVGAHVGTWALRLADTAKVVYAIEANLETYHTLVENVALNTLDDKVYPLYAVAWDRSNRLVSLVDVNNKPTGGSTRAIEGGGSRLTTTLDTLIGWSKTPIGLISMDVEGAEAKVLAGAEEVIMRDRPILVIELHEGHPGTDEDLRDQVYELLRKYDYTFTSLRVCPPEEHLLCTPNDAIMAEPETIKAASSSDAQPEEELDALPAD